jgi:cytochrome c553
MIKGQASAFPPPERGRDRQGVQSDRAQDDPHPNLPLFKGRGLTGVLGTIGAISVLLVATLSASAAGSVAAGRQKALQCQTCHGLDGLSKLPESPNIAGNPEQYLVRQLNAFRKGERKNDMMSIVVQQLSDQDVADLAAYYAAIEVTVKVPK